MKKKYTVTLIFILAVLAIGCDEYHYGYDIDDLEIYLENDTIEIQTGSETRYVKTSHRGITLHTEEDSAPWIGFVNGNDEPEPGYCGPTAAKNLLAWYGADLSYELLGFEMETNDWEPGFNVWAACAGACGGEIVICANACNSIIGNATDGTSIVNAIKTLVKYKPPGYELKYISEDPDQIESIIYQLLKGNPVIISEIIGDKTGEGHLSILAGIKIDDTGEIYVRMANSLDRSLDDFMKDWSLKKIGNKIVRSVAGKLGQRPFTAMYFNRVGEL